ncbi:MAG: ABC transporter transmembrane domain-containing protein [Myxococcota bacterium]|nr:ABC transporter transmembrane domain-containing protein [Myxococcota bacterium]
MKSFLRIIRLARPELGTLVLATLALFGTSALGLVYPQLVRLIIDGVLGGGGTEAVNRFATILIVLFAATAVLTAIRMYLFTVAGERIVARLRQRLFKAVVAQEVAFFDTHRTGELTNRLSADTTVVQNTATVNISMFLRHALTVIGALAILLWTSWKLTLVMLSLVPIAVVAGLFYGRMVRRLSRQVQDALARSTEVAEEVMSGIRTVRAFAQEKYEGGRYDERVDIAFDLARRRARINAIFGALVSFAGYGAISGVLWFGGILLVDGTLTMGALTSFLLYTFTVAFSIGALGSVWQDFMRAIGASERIFELLDRRSEVPAGTKSPTQVEGRMRFENVSFAYPSRPDIEVLAQVDLDIIPGQVLALVGPSGSGKSTIAALLSRFYDPIEGQITLDGQPLPELDTDWLRRRIGVVAQEPILFAASIQDNIRYGQLDATDDAVLEAARMANVSEFADGLPEGYHTEVGERGVRLSGGQKQRVAIARALLEDPPVLILDEATSALDAESEHLVQQALRRLMRGRTTIVIAHRLSTVKSADRIVVLHRGRVVQVGTHGKLMEDEGLYRRLVVRQLADESWPVDC